MWKQIICLKYFNENNHTVEAYFPKKVKSDSIRNTECEFSSFFVAARKFY